MSIGLATMAALLLLLPGVGFIAGVNFADKNVREIVFRNTPAEIGYVLIVSVVVHLLFTAFPHFNAAQLYVIYRRSEAAQGAVSLGDARAALAVSLTYFLAAAILGFGPGYFLGLMVRNGGKWRFFAKHPWMLDLAGSGEENTVYARVLMKHKFSIGKESTEHMIVVEGYLRDSYFDANGTTLYLVFHRFTELKIPLADPPYLGALMQIGEHTRPAEIDQLVIEGREIAMVRYHRLPLRKAAEDLGKIEEALEARRRLSVAGGDTNNAEP